ncbi:MAG: hypothetical protein KA138_08165 [Saprospiraceae bacterium]|nr:hypothetical protein [Saprospiraceae bacterium]
METKVLILISIGILLASCAHATSTPSPVTNTPAPTTIPTNIPTITFTPTTTPDPNAPEGTRGSDAQGEFIKMENGDIARKLDYKTATGEVLWAGWAVEKTQQGGISLLDSIETNAAQLRMFVQVDVPGGASLVSLTHVDSLDSTTNANALTTTVYTAIKVRENITDVNAWFKLLRAGNAFLSIITSTGETADVRLGPETGFVTIVVPYDSIESATVTGVTEWLDPYSNSRASFRSMVLGVDENGNAICLIGSEKPLNELPDKVIRMITLYHAGNIINDPDQTTQEWSDWLSVFVTYADAKGDKTVPDIIITRRQ